MQLFYFIACLFLSVACSTEQVANVSDNTKNRRTENRSEDYASTPSPVAGGFEGLSCSYKEEEADSEEVSVDCSFLKSKTYGTENEIKENEVPKLVIYAPVSFTYNIITTQSTDGDNYGWQVRFYKQDPKVSIKDLMSSVTITVGKED